jgi:GDP-L-fucose synthase
LKKNQKKIYIAGQEGMVGSAILRLLKKKNYKIIDCNRKKLDLTSQDGVDRWFKKNQPDIVINAAGKVGGILDNSKYQSDYLYINTMIGMNLVNASFKYKVKKLINLGSACIYPRNSKQPIKEEYLLNSPLEKTNEGYALAKILILKYCHFLKKKNNNFTSLQPANLYGENDNFNLLSSHVMPALIKKFHIAKMNELKTVEVWGSGNVKREFLHVDDLADAILFLLKKKISYDFVNVGGGGYISIKNLAEKIKKITKYEGKIFFNTKYPDGVIHRKMNLQRMNDLGWKAKKNLDDGLLSYYKSFKKIYKK